MNQNECEKLINLNSQFYQTTANYFDKSRRYFWSGWYRLVSQIQLLISKNKKIKILDLGCGNARFFEFLLSNFDKERLVYIGLDNAKGLIQKGFDRLQDQNVPISLFQNINKYIRNEEEGNALVIHDLFSNDQFDALQSEFDIICTFGFIHHIPSLRKRIDFLKLCARLARENGLFVFSLWKFLNSQRLKNKILDPILEGISPDSMEKNDYILSWNQGVKAHRYCHFVDEQEERILIDSFGGEIMDEFQADAKEQNINKYFVLKKS